MLLMLKLWNCYGICIFGKFRFCKVVVSCSGNVEIVTAVFGHEKNVVCWAFWVRIVDRRSLHMVSQPV